MIRKRRDGEGPRRGAMGIDGESAMDFTRKFAVDPWSYDEGTYDPPPSSGQSVAPKSRDILSQVEAQSRPRGDDNWGFDATGPVREVEDDE